MALGIIPGSVRLVLNREDMVNTNRHIPIIGMAIVTFSAKYLQLKSRLKQNNLTRGFSTTYSNTKNSVEVPVIRKTVSRNTRAFGAVMNLPLQ